LTVTICLQPGWSQELANLHGPCGYDRFGYSWRSRKGTVFHDSKGKHYSDGGYAQGDTVGCLIQLPQDSLEDSPNRPNYLGSTYKDCPLVKVKNFLYFETKDNIQQATKNLRPLEGSKVRFLS
jgi:Set1/Ash2 histone methyltransferase complex subunit ASH2